MYMKCGAIDLDIAVIRSQYSYNTIASAFLYLR